MHHTDELGDLLNRRAFFGRSATGLGSAALAALASRSAGASAVDNTPPGMPHYAPKARRVIYLFQSGGPAQMDLFDYKPGLRKLFGEEVPTSVYPAERKTTMSSGQDTQSNS